MIIREFTAVEYNSALKLWKETDGVCNCDICQFLHSKERLEKFFMRNPGLSFISVDEDDNVIGTILCGHDGRTGLIYRLTVSENHREIGIGTKLVKKSIEALREEDVTIVKAFVLNNNNDGNAFWEKIGFTVFDRAVTREYVIYDGK